MSKNKRWVSLCLVLMMGSYQALNAQALGSVKYLNDQNMPVTLGEMPRTDVDKVTGITVYKMPTLPYAISELAPAISAQTMVYHYGKHTLAYMENVNKMIGESPFRSSSLVDIICRGSGALYNNAAQFWNHSFFFLSMRPIDTVRSLEPMGKLAEDISKKWGSVAQFKQDLTDSAVSLFGSGWVWLYVDKKGHLLLKKTKDADNPLREGGTPILCLDVWEHAYYLDYQNKRKAFVQAWYPLVYWEGMDWLYRKVKNQK